MKQVVYLTILVVIVVIQFVLNGYKFKIWELFIGKGQQSPQAVAPPPAEDYASSTIWSECTRAKWCNITMPKTSYFRFSPPTDQARWKKAQIAAYRGDHVLLAKSAAVFPNHLDFLNGPSTPKYYNIIGDIFVDQGGNLDVLKTKPNYNKLRRKLEDTVIPVPPIKFDINRDLRAPVVKLGYETFFDRGFFFDMWSKVEKDINMPHVFVHATNENWGMFSTILPNRSDNWGGCCDGDKDYIINKMLDHEKTLMFVHIQHTNISHPKLINFPLGIAIHETHKRNNVVIWDTLHSTLKRSKKSTFVFSATSSFGARPQIVECIRKKFEPGDLQSNIHADSGDNRLTEDIYYRKLADARASIAPPGIGYDTFRLWESMILGTLPIVERGVGLDKMLWRLPALIVDDYDTVTPELLRTAYVEAIYRADEFEYERLKMSWWWNFLFNVSKSMSSDIVFEKFPLESNEHHFRRPLVPFNCWKTNSCGPGTMKIPKSSC